MAFILTKDRPANSPEEWQVSWSNYCDYLASIKSRLPPTAYDFASASWHYDFSDPKSPHDGWLDSLVIKETGDGERRQHRTVQLGIQLLGAFQNGHIDISYCEVQGYSLSHRSDLTLDADIRRHGDWLYDEVRLSPRGNVEHEIEWSGGSNWVIESKDIAYVWREDVQRPVEERVP